MFKGGRFVTSQKYSMEIYQVQFIKKIRVNNFFFILILICIFIWSECVFELCEVTLNPKQQSLVQRQTEQWKGKIKVKINKMHAYANMHLNYLLLNEGKCHLAMIAWYGVSENIS